MVIAGVPFEALLVFVRIGVALVSFVTEAVPNDVTAGIIVALAALEPAIGFTPRDGWAPTPSRFCWPSCSRRRPPLYLRF